MVQTELRITVKQKKTIKENSEKICDLQTSINFKIKELQYLDIMCKEKVKVLVKKIDSPEKKQIGEIIKNSFTPNVKICRCDENGKKQKTKTRGMLLKEEK